MVATACLKVEWVTATQPLSFGLAGIALGLRLEERAFEAAAAGGTTADTSYWTARVIHYPPLPQACGTHTCPAG